MNRIQQIIRNARFKLGDVNAERWTDDRLLNLVEAAQLDIVKQTKILKRSFNVLMIEGQHTYELPEDAWIILRATYNNVPLALKTYDEMDSFVETVGISAHRVSNVDHKVPYSIRAAANAWETDTGKDVLALIYDNREHNTIRVYPIPANLSDVDYTFDKPGLPEFLGDDYTGVVTAITDYTFNSVFGIVAELYDPNIALEHTSSDFGVVTGIAESNSTVTVWCCRRPASLTSVYDSLEVASIYDDAIMHYVVAHAFDDDVDARSMEKSNKALGYYKRELDIPASVARRDGVNSPRAPSSGYRGPFHD